MRIFLKQKLTIKKREPSINVTSIDYKKSLMQRLVCTTIMQWGLTVNEEAISDYYGIGYTHRLYGWILIV